MLRHISLICFFTGISVLFTINVMGVLAGELSLRCESRMEEKSEVFLAIKMKSLSVAGGGGEEPTYVVTPDRS